MLLLRLNEQSFFCFFLIGRYTYSHRVDCCEKLFSISLTRRFARSFNGYGRRPVDLKRPVRQAGLHQATAHEPLVIYF